MSERTLLFVREKKMMKPFVAPEGVLKNMTASSKITLRSAEYEKIIWKFGVGKQLICIRKAKTSLKFPNYDNNPVSSHVHASLCSTEEV